MPDLRLSWKDGVVLALVALMSLAANLPEEVAAQVGIDRRVLLGALIVLLVVALARYVRVTVVLAVAALAAGANLPAEIAAEFKISPDILTITLFVVVIVSVVNYFFKLLPTGLETHTPTRTVQGVRTLIQATNRGDAPTVRRLLAMGVDVNGTDTGGDSPLIHAARAGYSDLVQLLLAHGADPHQTNAQGEDALSVARAKGYGRTAQLLGSARPVREARVSGSAG